MYQVTFDKARIFPVYPIVCILLAVLISGCGPDPLEELTADKLGLQAHQARISPAEIFNESTRLLEPHLDLTTGAVRIEYAGPEDWLSLGYEVWENGVIKYPFGVEGTMIDVPFSGMLTMSLEDVSQYTDEPKYKVIYALTSDSGGGITSVSYYPKPAIDGFSSFSELREPLVISDGEEVAVWGYLVSKSGTFLDVPIPEQAANADWALVMKVMPGR